jgi:DNA-binding transcriptional LysR family regulator
LSLRRLEDVLGVKLFMRSKSGAKATKEADLLAKDVEKLLDDWERVAEKAKDATSLVKGNIKIGCHSSVALYAVKPWIKTLMSKYTDLQLSFEHDLSRKVVEQVISFKLDLAIVINPISHPDLVILPLLEDEVTLRKIKGKKVDESTLIYDPALTQVQTILQSLQKKKIEFKRHITTPNLEFVEHMVSLGLGVGVLPGKVCKNPVVDFNSSIKPFKDKLSLVYRADSSKTQSLEVVLKAIKDSFR